jgi:hypothetical protein
VKVSIMSDSSFAYRRAGNYGNYSPLSTDLGLEPFAFALRGQKQGEARGRDFTQRGGQGRAKTPPNNARAFSGFS